jgi:hypothetical protein
MNEHRIKLKEKRKRQREANQKYDRDNSITTFNKRIEELKQVKQTERVSEELAMLLKQKSEYIRKFHPKAYRGNRV